MAKHPLARQASSASGAVQFPTVPPMPRLQPFIDSVGFKAAVPAYDDAMAQWFREFSDALNRYFAAVTNNPP